MLANLNQQKFLSLPTYARSAENGLQLKVEAEARARAKAAQLYLMSTLIEEVRITRDGAWEALVLLLPISPKRAGPQ